MYWKCSNDECKTTLSVKDWTYERMAADGGPICESCDCDFELVTGTMPGERDLASEITKVITDGMEDTDIPDRIRVVVAANAGKPCGKRFEKALADAFPERLDVMVQQRHGFTEITWDWQGERPSPGTVFIAGTDKGSPIIDLEYFDKSNVRHYGAAQERNSQRLAMLDHPTLIPLLARRLADYEEVVAAAAQVFTDNIPDEHDIAALVGIESIDRL